MSDRQGIAKSRIYYIDVLMRALEKKSAIGFYCEGIEYALQEREILKRFAKLELIRRTRRVGSRRMRERGRTRENGRW